MRTSPRLGEYYLPDLDKTEPGQTLRVVGIVRAYNGTVLLWRGVRHVVVLVKAYRGYWSREEHYIPAEVQVLEIRGYDRGDPFVDSVWDKQTGRQSKAVQAEGIAEAKRRDRE